LCYTEYGSGGQLLVKTWFPGLVVKSAKCELAGYTNNSTCLFLFFILLAGTKEVTPLNEFYWLQADTAGITNAPAVTRWTPYGWCHVSNGKNVNCTSNSPAYAFDPTNNFGPSEGTNDGVPSDFVDSRNKYYYLSRFSYPFYIIGLFFSVVLFFLTLFAGPSRLMSAIAALAAFLALVFVAAASSLVTALYVIAKSTFNGAGYAASLGRYMMAWTWVSTFLLIVSFFVMCCGCCVPKRRQLHGDDIVVGERSSFEKSSGGKRGFFNIGSSQNDTSEAGAQSGGFFHHSAAAEPTAVEGERSSFERL
jgi:hypothetical protein